MSAHSLLTRATSLLTSRAGLAGALMVAPIATVHAQAVFTPTSSAFYTTTSGIPDYESSYGSSIDSEAIDAGASMKLWGDSGVRSRDSFSYLSGSEVRYRDGLTFAWRGTFTGELIGNHYDSEDNWVQGDALQVDYDFTVGRTHTANDLNWEIVFSLDGSGQTIRSGTLGGSDLSFNVTGSAIGGNSLIGSSTPTFLNGVSWSLYLVVKPYAYVLKDYWEISDTLHVIVPTESIDFSIHRSPSNIPEPSTWALIMGVAAFGVVMIRRRAVRCG